MDEAMAETVFDQAFGPFLQDESDARNIFDAGIALRERALNCLKERGIPDAEARLNQVTLRFLLEEVPLTETQSSLRDLIQSASDVSLRAQYSSFLDACLDSEEDQATARATLCRMVGSPCTSKRKPNANEIEAALLKVTSAAENYWASEPEQLVQFMGKFVAFAEPDQRDVQRTVVKAMAAPEQHLDNCLSEFYLEVDMYD